MKIKNSIALVTGSNRGLGRALVEGLLARGVKRVYAASRKPGPAHADPRVVPITLDITDSKSVAAAAAIANDVNLLVNNAGVFSAGPVLESTDAQLRGDMEVNYYGLLNAIRGFVPVLKGKPDATIVNVLSVVSLANITTFGGYGATKAAAWSLTQSLRNELKQLGIHIHAAFPGMIDTDMVSAYDAPKASVLEVTNGILDGVAAGTDDIAPDSASSGAMATYQRDPRALITSFAH
jgi:NAD(P)-dependent dehydrogenase (short-subunit alcohol dehydrogenase family)